jgi:hypothetical protein
MVKKSVKKLGLSALVAAFLGSASCTYNEYHDGSEGNNPASNIGSFDNDCDSPLKGKYGWEMNKCKGGIRFNDDCEADFYDNDEGRFEREVEFSDGRKLSFTYQGLFIYSTTGETPSTYTEDFKGSAYFFDPELRLQVRTPVNENPSTPEESARKSQERRRKINSHLDRYEPNTAILIGAGCAPRETTCGEGDAYFVFLDREYQGEDDCKTTEYYVGDYW